MGLWFAAAFLAYLVKGMSGFGNTLVFTSVLSFSTGNIEITPVDLLLGFPPNVIMAVRGRRRLEKRTVLRLSAMLLVGDLLGALILKNVNVTAVRVIFGLAVIAVAVDMLVRMYRPAQRDFGTTAATLVGILSGVMSGMFGVGAMMAAYIGRRTTDAETMKATVSAVFTADNIFRLGLYLFMGILDRNALAQALMLLPVALAGLYLGLYMSRLFDERRTRLMVILLLIVSGAALILQSI